MSYIGGAEKFIILNILQYNFKSNFAIKFLASRWSTKNTDSLPRVLDLSI